MPEKSQSGIGILTGSQWSQSGIGIPASGQVRYHWTRISPALPSYALFIEFSVDNKSSYSFLYLPRE
jgi:hypothetical protein